MRRTQNGRSINDAMSSLTTRRRQQRQQLLLPASLCCRCPGERLMVGRLTSANALNLYDGSQRNITGLYLPACSPIASYACCEMKKTRNGGSWQQIALLRTVASVLIHLDDNTGVSSTIGRNTARQAVSRCCLYSLMVAKWLTNVCLKKRPNLICYNLYIHGSIATIFGTNVAEKVGNQNVLYFPPHITSASALPRETVNPEIASFYLS